MLPPGRRLESVLITKGRHMSATTAEPERLARCRYLRRNDEQCTAEAIDPDADILICAKHAARVMRLIATQRETARRAPRSS